MSDLSPFFMSFCESKEFKESLKATIIEALETKQPTIPPPFFFTQSEAANILHCSIPSIIDYRHRGWLNAHRVGGKILYTQTDIDEAVLTIAEAKYRKV